MHLLQPVQAAAAVSYLYIRKLLTAFSQDWFMLHKFHPSTLLDVEHFTTAAQQTFDIHAIFRGGFA